MVENGFLDRNEQSTPQSALAHQTAKKFERFWNEANAILAKGRVPIAMPDVHAVDIPEPPIHHAEKGRAVFENVEEPHYLDGIKYRHKGRGQNESETNFIRRCTQSYVEKAGDRFDPKKSKVKDSIVGVALSLPKRSNYKMTILPEGELANFFGVEPFTSTEVLAKNGILPGAVSASANIYSDRVTLLRSIESEDGSVDSVAGRVQDLKTAKELAEFAFLSQMNLYQNPDKHDLAQGIVKKGDEYEFRFGAQSLLPMCFKGFFGGEEIKMVYKEIEAYKELEQLTRIGPLTIQILRIRPNHIKSVSALFLSQLPNSMPLPA